MKVTITSLKLRGPLKFFSLSFHALNILKQLKATNYKEFKKRGFWTTHYTMTLWESEDEMKNFARSGAHLEAMKESKKIAQEIRVITIDATSLPSWNEAKELLKEAKIISYN